MIDNNKVINNKIYDSHLNTFIDIDTYYIINKTINCLNKIMEQYFNIEPIYSLVKLALLSFFPDNTKLSISNWYEFGFIWLKSFEKNLLSFFVDQKTLSPP